MLAEFIFKLRLTNIFSTLIFNKFLALLFSKLNFLRFSNFVDFFRFLNGDATVKN